MQIRNSNDRYGDVAQLFHWITVALIITQFILANRAQQTHGLLTKAMLLTTHKSVGMTLFMLAVARLLWRVTNITPEPVPDTKVWQAKLASAMHWTLYTLILLVPLAGWLMSSARSYSVSWFGLFTFPDLIAPDRTAFELFDRIHKFLANLMALLALLHIAAALKHHFIDRDNVLRRMLPTRQRA